MRNAALAWCLAAALAGTARAAGQFQQSTDAGFDGGTYSSTYRSGSGSSVSVQLDYPGRAAGLALPGGTAWYNGAWSYRVPVTIQSTNGSTLTNYQVPLTLNTQALISAGRMRSDGADMRFTAADGVTAVNFYVLSGLNTASTVVWVQVPSVAASTTTTLYMYYGNAAASSASSLSSTFLFGDDFSTPDGTAPDAGRWSSIFTSSTSASLRETRGGLMHYSYGSYTSNGYFGLASLNTMAYSSGRRYRVVVNASNVGAGQKSAITLCTQASDCLSSLGFGSSWISFAVTHSTPAFTVQRAAGSGVVTLVPATNTSAGAHVVELLMKSGSYQANLDGVTVSSGSMTSITPYVQLEAGSNSSSQNDFYFGTMFVSQYATPEPTQAGVGTEQGAYQQAGTYASSVLDSGVTGTRYHLGNWASAVPGSTGLQFLARADDASIAAGTWTVVTAGADTGLSGRYFQYQSSFTTTDVRYTASVSSVTFAYTSTPPMPNSMTGSAVSSAAINWAWTDPSTGQFQPDGFRVLDSTGGTLASLGRAQFSWLQTGLSPNTAYQASAQAYNFVGSSATALTTQYTLTPPAAVSAAQSTGTWYGNGTVFAFTNTAGFGGGAVSSYRYAWTASPSYAFGGSEASWSAGTLSISTSTSGQYYLHVQPLNAVGAAAASLDLGPFLYDTVPPSVSGFSPSSSTWVSAPASVNVGLSDAGGSGLAGVQYQWLASSGTQPSGGWSSMDTSVNGSSATINRIQFANGSWFLHILVTNIAGATGYAEAGPYKVDVTSPTGSLSINGGAAFASTTTVALSLSYADSVSGVLQVRYRNVPGSFTAWELPASTRAWTLSGTVGVSTVEYQIVDFASNTATYQATIFYSRQTGLALANQTIVASGETPAQTSTATPTAVLTAAASGATIAGETISFQLLAATAAANTDGSGSAAAQFAVPSSSGVYMSSATFNGDASYDASFATAALTVTPRSSFLVTPGASASAASSVTISISLIDLATAVGLVSKPVSISFQGSTVATTTDGSGAASATFSTPGSSGTFSYSASYAGGATYGPVTANGSVTVGRRGVLVVGAAATANVNQPFGVQATLFDLVSGSRVSGKTIVFRFLASTGAAATDGTGVASMTFVSASTGSINCVATFAGDAAYAAGSDTQAVAVNLRPTTVTPVSVSTTVGSPFTVSAVVTDQLSGSALPGESLTFTFGAASATLTTDASGYAETSFTAPSSSGSYSYTAAAGGGQYNGAASANGSLTVGRRSAALTVQNASSGASSVFTASATLTDFGTGAPLAGEAVYLQFQSSAVVATTNGSGIATATFTAPGGVGGYSLAGTFSGDTTYLPASSTGTITVNTRATTLTAVNVTVPAASVFTASATLTETVGSAPIGGKTVVFRFQGTQQLAVTDGAGLAQTNFTAPSATGTYSVNADFAGDSLYVASSDTKTVTATLRPLVITPAAAATSASSVWAATATVTDGLTSAAVQGLNIRLTFQAVTSTVASSAQGVAAATFTAPSSTGTYAWQAWYPGDSTYQSASVAGTVAVSARPSQILLQNVSVVTNRILTATATLTDLGTGSPLNLRTVYFSFQGSTLTATTNASGVATRTFSAPASSGTYSMTAWFAGDATNASSTGTATVTVIRLPVQMAGQDITTTASATFNPQEVLTDAGSGAPLSGRTINFTFMTSTMAVVTDANGVAVATFTAPSTSTLTNYTATFAGDTSYAPGSDQRVVAVGFRFTVTVPFNTFGLAMDPSTFTAKLIDAQTQGALSGQTLSLNIQTTTHTAVTDVNGLASSTFTLPSSSGTYAFNGSFGGQGFYTASAATATITVLSRPTIMWGGLSSNNFDRFATLGAFNGSWQLQDSNNFLGVAGRTVNVYYHSSTTTITSSYTVTTNGSGNFNLTALNMQTSTFSATGTVIFAFLGDPTYSSATLSQGFTVVPRYTDINVDGPTANAGLPFNVGATLRDSGGNGPIAGRTITFTFQGSTATGTTDATGHAVAPFTAPSSTGSYNVTANYAGDTTYGSTGGTGVVTVINRQSLLSAGAWDCGVMLSCSLSSVLSDFASGAPISGASVTFHVAAGTYTASTNGSGVVTIVVPGFTTTGGRTIYSNFSGNGSYLPAYSTATLPVNLRPTLLGVADQQVQRLDNFPLAAGLQEYYYQPATPVVGATVTFVFNGSTYTARTDQYGTATATVTAPSALGTYAYSASFVGDSTFTSVSNSANIIVGKRDTQLSGTNSQPAWGQFFYAVAQLQDGSTAISGATITFALQGSTQTSLTNSLGIATAPFTAPSATGTYTMNLSYAGSALYNASTATASILADRRLTTVGAANLTTSVLSTFTALASLTDQVSGGPIAGSTIAFTYLSSSASVVTNASGVSTAAFVAPSTSAVLYSANYAGNGLYYPSTSSGTLSISLRQTSLLAANNTAAVSQAFTASSQLLDFETGSPILGSTVMFTFQGSTKTAATDGTGTAAVTFTAPAATGTYTFTSYYSGSAVYLASTGTATVGVYQRTTSLTPSAVTTAENTVFTAQATFIDSVSGLPVAGATVTFVFNGSTVTALTDASGVASSTYTAPASSGTYTYSASFAGNGTYTATTSNASVTVGLRTTSLIVSNVPVLIGDAWTASAQLIDSATGLPVSTRTVSLLFAGSTQTASTNGGGVASVTESSRAAAGSFPIYGSFAGDATYAAASGAGVLTVSSRTTSVTLNLPNAYPGEVFVASATLTDVATGSPVSTATLVMTFQASSAAAVTNGAGLSTATFASPASTGTYSFVGTFPSAGAYVGSSATGTVTALPRPTTLSVSNAAVILFSSFTATASLTDTRLGTGVSGATVSFVFNGATQTVLTNGLGTATTNFAAPATAGGYVLTASFAGSSTLQASAGAGSVNVTLRPTLTVGSPLSTTALSPFSATAQIKDATTSSSIPGVVLVFTFNASSSAAATNGSGQASGAFAAPASSGSINYVVTFAGSSVYAASSDTEAVTIGQRPVSIALPNYNSNALSPFSPVATVTDVGAASPMNGRGVTFVFQSATETATTNGLGQATTNYVAPNSIGSFALTAATSGDATYAAAFASATVLVQSYMSTVTVQNATALAGQVFIGSATLQRTYDMAALVGSSVVFQLQGVTSAAITNSTGIASSTMTAPTSSGTYTYSATFGGDGIYLGAASSGTLTVNPWATTLTAGPAQTVSALTVITATATLTRTSGGAAQGGRTITFSFQGNNNSGVTNGSGVATATFTAVSSGTWNWAANFAGDASNAAVSTGAAITVNPLNTALSVQNVNDYTLRVITATATLTSGGQPVAGRTVIFTYQGASSNTVTDASGNATAGLAAGQNSGSYNLVATFVANPTYNGSSSTATATINVRPTSLAMPAVTAYATDNWVAFSTLTDVLFSPAAIATQTVTFWANGVSSASITNGGGGVWAAYSAPAASGTYVFYSTYTAGSTYGGSNASANLNVLPRPTALNTPAVTTGVNLVFIATATLTDVRSTGALGGRTVIFVYGSSSFTALTDGLGVATAAFTSPGAPTVNSFSATFSSGSTYSGVSSTATVNVILRPTSLAAVAVPSVYAQNVFYATATLTDPSNGSPLTGKSVYFSYYFSGSSVSLTNASGTGTVNYNAGNSSGSYTYSATFPGDATWAASASTVSVTVSPRPTAVAPQNVPLVYANNVFTASATLTDALNTNVIAGQPLSFAYSASSASLTNASGLGTVTFNAGASSGTRTFSVTLSSGGLYSGVSGTATVTIAQRPVSLIVQTTTTLTLTTFITSATLTDGLNGGGISGQTLWFNYGGGWQQAVTNASGTAAFAYASGSSSGTYTYSATLVANPTYQGASSSGTVTVNPRSTTMSAPGAAAWSLGNFTAQATLTDTLAGTGVSGKTVSFLYLGTTQTATTDGLGVATTIYYAGASSGTYSYTASLAADPTYLASSSSPAVLVSPRPTSLPSQAVVNYVSQVFTASATLTDVLTTQPIAGRTVTFLYLGTSSSSLTNANGLATVTYNAGVSSGSYSYSVTLSSGPTYAGVSSTSTVTVNPRPTTLAASAVPSILANAVFTASATLTDVFSGGGAVAGRTVTFLYLGTSSSSLTNASGLATVTYNAGASSGAYSFSATYLGEGTYAANSATATVTVLPRPTALASQAAGPVYAATVFTASSTLTDATSLGAISGQTLSFLFQGTSSASLTNASGLGTVTFNAGTASGTWTYSVTLSSGALYAGVSSTANVTVSPRPTVLTAQTTTEYTFNNFTASATLTDGLSGNPLNGQLVWFNYGGSWQSAATNGSGIATFQYAVGSSSGSLSYSATFAPTPTYVGSSSTATLTATPRPTTLAAPGAAAWSLGVFTASATLTDNLKGTGVNGKTVTFWYLGSSQTATTNALGLATTAYAAGSSSGTYYYQATFASDPGYVGSSSAPVVSVKPRPTLIAAPAATTIVDGVFTASGTLTDMVTGGLVSGQTLSFAYYASSGAAATNASGFASSLMSAGSSSGTYTYSVTISSGPSYAGSASTASVTVNPRPTLMAVNAVASVAANDLFIATATLTDQGTGQPVAGRTVTFLYQGGSSSSSLTNASGQATVTYGAGSSAGAYTYTATFTGDSRYAVQSATASVTVVRRPTTASASATTAYATELYIASATLNDVATGPLSGQTLWFSYYTGASSTSLTNASGLGTVTYNAGTSSGTYQFNATLPQNATYSAASSSANVTVLPRPTLVAAAAVPNAVTNAVFTASATLTDVRLNSGLSGQTVYFAYGASTGAAATNGSGLATFLFNAGPTAGSSSFSATLSSGPTYAGQSSTATVTITQRNTVMVSAAIPSVNSLNVFTASATLNDQATGAAIAGRTVSFNYLGTIQTAVTSGLGTATTNYAAGPSSGSYQYSATFVQDSTYFGSSSTSAVTVVARPTLLAAAAASAPAAAVFTASATLTDVLTTNPVAGQTVWFSLGGASSASLTNASGLATVTFSAPGASGSYQFSATLSSGPTYAGQSSTATLTATSRATALASQAVPSVYANRIFTATATLTDVWTSTALAGRTVTFLYLGTSSASLTNASGQATVTYSAGSSSGTLSYSATFGGDAEYAGQSSTSTVAILPRPTSTTVYGVGSVYVNGVFNATATVSDLVAGGGVSGQTVYFSYRGTPGSASTNGGGQAFLQYNAGASSGAFSYVATIASGPAYGFSSATATVNVVQRPITVAASATSGFVNTVFVASATLTDGVSGSPASGYPVTFLYQGTSSTSLTNASGLATVTYNTGASSGAPTFSATYVPDAVYAGGSSTATVTVKARPTSLAALPVGATPAISPFTAAATLTDALDSSAVSGQTIWFAYQSGISSAATNGSGTASVSFSAGTSSGTYQFSATLSSGAVYAGVSSSASVTVTPRPTSLSMPALGTAQTLSVFIASATLTDATSLTAIASQTVSFVFNGSTVTGLSNGVGLATASFATPSSSGTYAVTAALAANPTYTASAASSTITLAARLTALAGSPVSVYANEAFGSTSTLTDAQSLGGVGGRVLSFLFQTVAASGTTNGSGVATGAYSAPSSSGPFSFATSFAGDATYAPASTTTAVTVLQRPTGLSAAAPAAVFANAVFTATATLTDLRAGGTGAAGRTVTISYRSQSRPAVTNGSGVAVATFTAEVTTGTYNLAAAFAGDSLYASSASAAVAIAVQPRPTAVAAAVVPSVYALGVFTATATLTDAISTTPVSGRTVYFSYAGSSGAAVTDGSGGAYVLFAAGSSTGAATWSATFAPDATYAGGGSTAAVTVSPRPTSTLASPATAYASTVFTASATLTDVPSGLALPGKTLSFVFGGSTRTATTNGSGFASSTFTAPSSSGAYVLSVALSTDAIYVGSVSTAEIDIVRKPSVDTMPGVVVQALNVFTASATLTDGLDASVMAGVSVSFVFQGTTQTALTNGLGLATTTFFAPSSAGSYPVTSAFAGDSVHAPSTGSASVLVSPRPSAAAAVPASVVAGDVFTATATFTDGLNANPIAGAAVKFFFPSTQTATTDGSGVATSTFSAPLSTGVYAYVAQYPGSSTYLSTSAAAAVTVTARPTTVSIASATAYVASVFTATATMRDVETGGPVAGRTISFVVGGATVTATTDGAGAAYASLTAPGAAGSYGMTAAFAADATYAAAFSSTTLTAVTRPTSLSTATASAAALDPLTLTATLTDAGSGAPLAGRTVSFVLFGSTQTGVTNGLGQAATGYVAVAASGTYVFTASFGGDASYSSTTISGAAAVLARPTSMTARNFTTVANAVFTATGTLRDVETSSILAGKTVQLHFNDGATGQDALAVTDAFGNAVTTFTAPSGTGLFNYTAKFLGDATYGISIDTGFVQIGLASTLIAGDISTIELDTFTFSAKLIDPYTQPISSRTITFTFRGSTQTATTDATGVARSTFTAPASSGSYAGAAAFAGDTTYAPSNANITINVAQRGTTLAAASASVLVGSSVTVTARLRDNETSVGVSSKTVVFTVFGSTRGAVTDASGNAAAVFPPAPSSGSFSIAAAFAGDAVYAPSNDASTATVSRIPTSPVPLPASGSPSTLVPLTLKLLSLADGSSLPGEAVIFQLGAATAAATTDANGQASANFTAPAASGTYTFSTLFQGDTTYASSSSSGTLSIGLRATGLAAAVSPAFASAVFSASATLTDTLSAAPVSTETVVFTFNGSTASAVTNGAGVALATFTAPASTGSFTLGLSFGGDSTYATSTAAAVVAVAARPVAASALPATVPVGGVFVATATFSDALSGSPLASAAIAFSFNGATAAASTDGVGFATASFAAPASSGSYALAASYAGAGVEAPASATATVTVVQLGSLVTAPPASAPLNASFSVSATLLAQSNGAPLSGQTLQFVFLGSTASATTNGSGVASATFTAPGTLGVYGATATYAGGAVYSGASAVAAVSISSRPTVIALPAVNTTALQVFTATITLTDVPSGLPLGGSPVSFFFQGSTFTAVTNGSGVALATFTAPGSTGTFALNGLFAGTTVYLSTQAFSSVSISSGGGTGGTGGAGGGQGTVLLAADLSTLVSRVFVASATLTLTSGGSPVPNETISFDLNGTTLTAVTNAVGLATVAFTAPATSGTFIMAETFAGDATFNAAYSTSAVYVLPEPTRLTVPDVLTSSGSIFIATATLTVAASSAPLSARSVDFLFQGTTVAATTNGSGVAFATFLAPTSSGSFVLNATYVGDPTYAVASASAAVVVQANGGGGGTTNGNGGGAPVVIQFPAPVSPAVYSQVFTASATLFDPSAGLGVAGRKLFFVYQGSTNSGTTDAYGVAQATFMAPASFGPYVLSSYFVGDSTYVAVSATNTVIVGLGLVPADPANLVVTTQTTTMIQIAWDPVTLSVNGLSMSSEVVKYAVERSTDLSQGWQSWLSVSSGLPTALTLSTVTVDTWVRVVAVSREGYRSPGLAALHLSSIINPSRVFLAPSQDAWVEVPPDASKDLDAGGSKRAIVLTTITAPGYVFAYQISVWNGNTVEKDFTFNNYNGVTLIVSIDRAAQTAAGTSGLSVSSLKRVRDGSGLGLFYWNGVEWVKLGAVQNLQNGQASINLRRTGQFAAGFTSLASAFTVTKVAPRVFTPSSTDSNFNRAIFYFQNPDGSSVNVRIFDITGATIRSTLEAGPASNGTTLAWDGKDDGGKVVKGGVYIYQIEAGGKKTTGTIAVAR